jgi:hypothetical protein
VGRSFSTPICRPDEGKGVNPQAVDEKIQVATGDPSVPAVQESHTAAAAYTDAARKVLLTDAGVRDFGESNVELLGASSALEKMLVDQLTVCHNSAMRLAARASTIGKVPEMVRLMNLSLRCMTVFQEGAATLDRLRRRGQQVITIQHVSVQGGQAVIAGSIERGASAPRASGGRHRANNAVQGAEGATDLNAA